MDDAYDVVIAGGGVAGVAAAVEAADRGASVLLAEKTGTLGGSSVYSGGNLLELSGPGAISHLDALCSGRTPREVLEAYAEGLRGLRGWLEGLGARFTQVTHLPASWPNMPGAETVSYYAAAGPAGEGPALFDVLEKALARRAVDVRLSTSVEELVLTDGRVVGARLAGPAGPPVVVGARAGVVLATGGFENSAAMTEAYLPIAPTVAVGSVGNTGDGTRLAASVDAALWHMSAYFGFWAFRAPGYASATPILAFGPGFILVDGDGRRFHAEAGREAHDILRSVGDFLPGNPNRPSLPAWLVFDGALLDAGPLARFPSPTGPSWSPDNRRELAAGWITQAPDPASLALALGLDPQVLTATVAGFNAAARTGTDAAFGRAGPSMAPLGGDLYAIEVWPGLATTCGGPRRDGDGRVLRWDGSAIAGLYAAGGNGSVWGALTEHGGGLTDGLVFGPRAVRHALGVSALAAAC